MCRIALCESKHPKPTRCYPGLVGWVPTTTSGKTLQLPSPLHVANGGVAPQDPLLEISM